MQAKNHQTLRHLLVNSRFYVLAGSVLLSVMAVCWLRYTVPAERLFYIRCEQVFGMAACIYLFAALAITPLQKVYGDGRLMNFVLFTRRGVGVSAAYFAALHAAIALWGQLGGLAYIALLPDRFRWSLALGVTALAILVLMAAISFDKAVQFLTFPRWKRIQRLAYIAGVLVIVHVWLIGTHARQLPWEIAGFAMLAILFGLEAMRISRAAVAKRPGLQHGRPMITLLLWILFIMALVVTAQAIPSYHEQPVSTGVTNANR